MLGVNQLGPDVAPVVGTKIPTRNVREGGTLDTYAKFGRSNSPVQSRRELSEVYPAYAYLLGERLGASMRKRVEVLAKGQ